MIIMNTMINVDHSLPLIMTITKMGTITVITMITNNHVIIKNIETHVVNAERTSTREAYEAEHQYEPQQHDAYMNDESESHNYDETDDKYAQFPKRAVESEYKSTQQEEEEPAIMSRQAKYNKKSKKLSVMNNSKKIIIKMKMIVTVMRMVMLTTKSHKNLKLILENLRLNARKKKLKFVRRKEKEKAYNKRMKERRKNQPSAVNQRRMNYEERRQMFQGEQPQEDNQENQVEHKDDTENK